MRFELQTLREKLNVLEGAYKPKNAMPVLTFLKIADNSMVLSNSEDTIKVDIETGDIHALVPFKTFKDIVGKMTNDIDLEIEGTNAIIKSGRSKYRLSCGTYADYPNIDMNVENGTSICLDTKVLKTAIMNTIFSTATNEKKPILTGVNFHLQNNVLECVATDSFRLSRVKIDCNEETDFAFTIGNQQLEKVLKCININNENTINIIYNRNNVLFECEKFTMKTRLLDGTYPNTSKLINFDSVTLRIAFNKNELIDTISRVSLLSSVEKEINNKLITLNFSNNEVVLKSISNQLGEAKESLETFRADDPSQTLKITFSSDYILEAIKTFETENIVLHFTGDVRPIIITDSDMSNANVQIVLPVRVE